MPGAALCFPHSSFGTRGTIRRYENSHFGIPHDEAGSETDWHHLHIQTDPPLRDMGVLVILLQVSSYCRTIRIYHVLIDSKIL